VQQLAVSTDSSKITKKTNTNYKNAEIKHLEINQQSNTTEVNTKKRFTKATKKLKLILSLESLFHGSTTRHAKILF